MNKKLFQEPRKGYRDTEVIQKKKKSGLLEKELECNLIERDNVEVRTLIKAGISQLVSVCRRLLDGISFTTSSIDLADCQVTNRVAALRFAILNSKYEIKIFAFYIFAFTLYIYIYIYIYI